MPKENPPAGLGAAAAPVPPKEKAGVVEGAALVEPAGAEALLPKLNPPVAGWVGVAGLLLLLAAPKPLKPPPKALRGEREATRRRVSKAGMAGGACPILTHDVRRATRRLSVSTMKGRTGSTRSGSASGFQSQERPARVSITTGRWASSESQSI